MPRSKTETTVHVQIERDEDGNRIGIWCGVRRPGKPVIERYDEVIIHGPCRLLKTEDGNRILLHTDARVEGRKK